MSHNFNPYFSFTQLVVSPRTQRKPMPPTPAQKPDLPVQQDILFNDLYQEVRCAAPSAQVIFFKGIYIKGVSKNGDI